MTTTAHVPVAAETSNTDSEEDDLLLVFMKQAGFPEGVLQAVDQATKQWPVVRQQTDLRVLVQVLKETGKPDQIRVARMVTHLVVRSINNYPQGARHKITQIVQDHPEPCPATVFAALLVHPGEVQNLVKALLGSPAHEAEAFILRACPR